MISPGTRLGPYEITARIGAGGMGEVFRAHDERIGRDVAIKVLPASFAADADRLERFEQEARSAGTLNHPNLVTIYDIGSENGAPYLVMELLDGETLRDKLTSPHADLKKNLLAVADAADAIAAAHRAGVIHRDLKPENIIVTNSGYTKVLDFGLAKLVTQPAASESNATDVKKTDPGVVLGTAGYMSPEQAQGKPADQRSDIFALGCILYEALTGKRAFAGISTVDTLHNIIHAEPPPVRSVHPELPSELQRIVRKCLAKDPEERYQSSKDLAIDLRNAVRDLGSAPNMPAVAGRRSMALILVAGFALAAIAAAVAWYAARHSRGPLHPTLTIHQLTNSGDVTCAAISPDGKYLAYVTSRQGQQGLWLQQIGTSQRIPLVPPSAGVSYWGHVFSRDGTSIYFATHGGGAGFDITGSLFQIGTLGGTPRKVLTRIDSSVSFSPDGKQFAFLRGRFPKPGQSALLIANADGSGEHTVAVKSAPELFIPIFFAGPAWSPDGTLIAASVIHAAGVDSGRLSVFDVKSGAERKLTTARWRRAAQSVWLPDGRSLVTVALSTQSISSQLWKVDYPSGEAQALTSGTPDYRNPSITADGKTIEAVAAVEIGTIYLHAGGASSQPKAIGATQHDGAYGMAFTPDHRLVFTTFTATGTDLWISDLAGGARQQITTGNEINRDPAVTRDGILVFVGAGDRGVALWKCNLDGSNLAMLTPASYATVPFASPDGQTIYFNSDLGSGSLLYKIPIAGGRPVPVGNTPMTTSTISRDGKWIAGAGLFDGRVKLAILDAASGAVIKTFIIQGSNYTRYRWSADGKTIDFNANSQLLSLDTATGTIRPLLSYEPPDLINAFDLASDGSIVVSHGPYTRDAFLITGLE